MRNKAMSVLMINLMLLVFCAGNVQAQTIWDPKPTPANMAKDLVLPMPNGMKMVFRPVFVTVAQGPFSNRTFKMGGSEAKFSEYPTAVSISGSFKGQYKKEEYYLFYLGKYEVTEGQYYSIVNPAGNSKSRLPITGVTWLEVQQFIDAYNQWLLKNHRDALPENPDTNYPSFLRLPTEGEWEFAARGGLEVDERTFFQETPYNQAIAKYERFFDTGMDLSVSPIGNRNPNPLYLFDVLGNAAEIIGASYQNEYYQGRVGAVVVRGGSFGSDPKTARSSARQEMPLYNEKAQPFKSPHFGFRLAVGATVSPKFEITAWYKEEFDKYLNRAIGGWSSTPAGRLSGQPLTRMLNNLSEAGRYLYPLIERAELTKTERSDLQMVIDSLGNFEKEIKESEQRNAFAYFRITTALAAYMVNTKLKSGVLGKSYEIIGTIVDKKAREQARQTLDKRMAALDEEYADFLSQYIDSLSQLAELENSYVEQAYKQYIKRKKQQLIKIKRKKDILLGLQLAAVVYDSYRDINENGGRMLKQEEIERKFTSKVNISRN